MIPNMKWVNNNLILILKLNPLSPPSPMNPSTMRPLQWKDRAANPFARHLSAHRQFLKLESKCPKRWINNNY